MALERLVFYSRSTIKVGEAASTIKGILSVCSEYSPISGLTGGLVFNEKFFIQVMEGSREQISRQLKNLYLDERHEGLTVLSLSEINSRDFPGWSVGYAGRTISTEALFLKYGATIEINPVVMHADAVLSFVRDFCAIKEIYVQHSSNSSAEIVKSSQKVEVIKVSLSDRK